MEITQSFSFGALSLSARENSQKLLSFLAGNLAHLRDYQF